jgi:hypothetical protein
LAKLSTCESLPENASIHWVLETNNSSADDGSTSSMRMGKIGFLLLTARSTSRATKGESLLALERIKMKARDFSIPRMISSP